MRRKDVYINALPAVIWLLLFLCTFILKDFGISNFIGITYIFMLFLVPLFYGIYNFCVTHAINMLLKLYGISLISQLMGLFLNGTLYYCFISSDPETPPVVRVFLLVTLIFTIVVNLIAILLKFFTRRFRKM